MNTEDSSRNIVGGRESGSSILYRRRWNLTSREDEPDHHGASSEYMLAHAKLSNTFCVEALMTMTYVIDRSPATPLDGDTPQRVWTGKDISYRHLKVFGYLAFMHIAKDKREKLDPRM